MASAQPATPVGTPSAANTAAAERPTKKRKSCGPRGGAGDGERRPASATARCSLCGFSAATLDHLLTHVRETHGHNHNASTSQMALPLEVAQMLVQYALDQAALGGATSAWLGELQIQYRAATELMTALQQQDASAVAAALCKLQNTTPSSAEDKPSSAMHTTLQNALQLLLQPANANVASAASIEVKTETLVTPIMAAAKTTAATTTCAKTTATANAKKNSSTHEAEAAQALTGLRGLGAADATASTRPPAVPKTSPRTPHASFPSFPTLSITAPPPLGSPRFHPPELFTPGSASRSPGTPSSLPSLFSRRLLAPLASPSTAGGAGVGFAAPRISTDPRGPSAPPSAPPSGPQALLRPDASPASLTPVYYRSFPQAGPAGRPASPAKRRSLTSKQLSVRCDAEVAAARAAASASTSAFGSAPAPVPVPSAPVASPATPVARKANPRRWTAAEDEALRSAVESHREKNWKAIAAHVAGRNHTQCLQRWTKVLAPGLVKGHWSPHEDELLRRLVAADQKNWGDVAAKIPGRTSKQCRERWHNHLDPAIVRGAYSPEEDRLILEAQARLGNRWSVIAAMLPGRTEDAVKIRWKSHCRVWRARKYLRTNPGAPEAEAEGLSEPAMTPRTPLVPVADGAFVWPKVDAADDRRTLPGEASMQ